RTCSGSVGGIRGISSVHILAPPGCANQYLCVVYWKSVSRTSGFGRRTCGLTHPAPALARATHGTAARGSVHLDRPARRTDQLEHVFAWRTSSRRSSATGRTRRPVSATRRFVLR